MERFAIKIDERVKLNLYNICRLCGIDNRDQVPICDEPDTTFILDDEPSLCKKIVDCVGIQVETTDRMPQKICTLCVDKINDFYEYREMCKATNIQTRELLGLPPDIKDEKPSLDSVSSSIRQQHFVEIPAENVKRKRKLKSECINYEEIDDDEIDEKPPKKKFPKNSVGAKSKKQSPRKILVKRESVKPLPSRILPTREKATPVPKEKPATLIKEKLITPPIKEKAVKIELKEKPATVKEKHLIVKEKPQTMKEKIIPQSIKEKGHLSKEKLQPSKEKLLPTIKDKFPIVKEKTQPEKEKLKPVKEKSINSKLPILKDKSSKEKLFPLVEEKIELVSSKVDTELITLKTPNRRERQRELETKKKRKIQTLQPFDKVKTENLYACVVCPKDFKTQPEYDIHFFREHTPNTLDHGCSACREAFYDLQEYRDHQLWHRLSSIPFSCFKCDSHFDRITAYTRHFLTSCVPHIDYNIVDDIKCQKCQKTFVTKNLYEWHGCLIKNNSKCPRCSKFFAKRLNLQRHVVLCNNKMVETQTFNSEGSNKRSEPDETEAFTANSANNKKTVKIEPGSILEIDDESHIAVPNNNDDDDHEMEESIEDDVGFQDDHEQVEEFINVNARAEIDSSANLEKDTSDIIPIPDETEQTAIRPIKQEKVDRRYDEVICRSSSANIPMVQIKQEIFNSDYANQVDLNILRNIKPEPVECAPEPNSSKNDCSASASELPNQTTKVAATKPTLKLKIKKEHGTLNSSFIDSDLGEGGDSSPNPNRSYDDESSTSHHRKKRNKHKKKIYKIPKQLALIIKQEKQSRENCDEDTSFAEGGAEPRITVPVISEVTSIAETSLETPNTLNQSGYYEEEETPSLSICFPSHSREITEEVPIEPQKDVQIPVIADVVSLKLSEASFPLISSVTSLSQASGIRVKMEFSNFASPRPDPCETNTVSGNRLEQDDMITGNYIEYDTVEKLDDHLESTDSEEVTLSTSKGSIESDIEEKPNLTELMKMSEFIPEKIQNSTENVLVSEKTISSEFETSHLTNTSIKSTVNVFITESSEISPYITEDIKEKNEVECGEENQPAALNVKDVEILNTNSKNENVTDNSADENYNDTIENVENNTDEIVLTAAKVITATYQDVLGLEIPRKIDPANDHIEMVNVNCEDNSSEKYIKSNLQLIVVGGSTSIESNVIEDNLRAELTTLEINDAGKLDNYVDNDDILGCNPETDYPDHSISIVQKNIDCDESNSTDMHSIDIGQNYGNIEKVNPVTTRSSGWFNVIGNDDFKAGDLDLLQPNQINVHQDNVQSQIIHMPEIDEESNKISFQNNRIEHAISSGINENKPRDLVIYTQINVQDEALKRHLKIDDNSEESKPKIQKLGELSLDVDVELKLKEPLELRINHIIDEISQPTPVISIKNEDIISETAKDNLQEVQSKFQYNPVSNEEELKRDRQYDTTPTSEDDIDNIHAHSESNILDLQIDSINNAIYDQIIKTDVFDSTSSDHDEESVTVTPKHEIQQDVTLEDEIDLENQRNESIGIARTVLSCNIIENKGNEELEDELTKANEERQDELTKANEEYEDELTKANEEYEDELTKGEISIFYSSKIEETEYVNKSCEGSLEMSEPIQDKTNNNSLEEANLPIASENFVMQITEDHHKEINELQLLESSNSANENSSIAIQDENNLNIEEAKVVTENVEMGEDLKHEETESRNQHVGEDNVNQRNNFTIRDEELPMASEDQHDEDLNRECNISNNLKSSTKDLVGMSNKFQTENDINMENIESNIGYEGQQDLANDEDLCIEYNVSNTETSSLEDNASKCQHECDFNVDDKELTYDAMSRYPQQVEDSNNIIISESISGDADYSSNNQTSINVKDEESMISLSIGVASKVNLEETMANKNENKTDNLLGTEKLVLRNIKDFSSSLSEIDERKKYPSEGRIQTILENELDEISYDSCASLSKEIISDTPLKKDIMDVPENIEFGGNTMKEEENLSTVVLEVDKPLNDLKKTEEHVFETHSDSSRESTNITFDEKLAHEPMKQVKLIKTSEITSCDRSALITVKNDLINELDKISDDSSASPMKETISDTSLQEDIMDVPENTKSYCNTIEEKENLSTIILEVEKPLDDFMKPEEPVFETNSDSNRENTNITFDEELAHTTKQAEKIKTEISSCDNVEQICQKSLDCIVDSIPTSSHNIEIDIKDNLQPFAAIMDFKQNLSSSLEASQTLNDSVDSISTSSHNIEIDIKDNLQPSAAIMDFKQNLSSSLEASQTLNDIVECTNTARNLMIEKTDELIVESSASLQTNNIITPYIETVPKNIHIMSSDVILEQQINRSHENLNDNLDNITNCSVNVLQTNPTTDGIIYRTIENVEDIDSDLEKELLEETNDGPDK